LLNLIGNAIKYRGGDAPEIHVSAEEGEHHWTITVCDNGLGISHDDQQRIFEAFVRVHQQHQIEGSGIGLALCQRIVANHGGHIWVESEPGNGSKFVFTLSKMA
jgi:signal transduction histidine kinase